MCIMKGNSEWTDQQHKPSALISSQLDVNIEEGENGQILCETFDVFTGRNLKLTTVADLTVFIKVV